MSTKIITLKINDLHWGYKYCMECKFLKHGIALSYDQIVKPCCAWKISDEWRDNNHYQTVDLANWHRSPQVQAQQQTLKNNQWPKACIDCEKVEVRDRQDSMRGNGNQAYAEYDDRDITLEIRPGSTCNFACQTCWPEASSRVAQYYNQAGLIDIKNLDSRRLDNFEFLLPIAHRIRNVVLLGGEPFYDKSCLKFLRWAQENLKSHIMMFTNGSTVDHDWLKIYPGKLTVIFSLDAVGRPAEYVRVGTIWDKVLENYKLVRSYKNIEVRVNITCSIYNYVYIEELIGFLCEDWPDIVTFGSPRNRHFLESVVPVPNRQELIESLQRSMICLEQTDIDSDQKINAVNAIHSIVQTLNSTQWDQDNHKKLCNFILQMDRVKNINLQDYCPETHDILQQNIY